MPATGQGSGTGNPPVNILIGRYSANTDVTSLVDWSSVRIEETGNQEGATFDCALWDLGRSPFGVNAWAQMRSEWRIKVNWKNPVTSAFEPIFNGFIRTPSPEQRAIYGELAIHAEDAGSLMDRLVVETQGVSRASGESDKARIAWLFGGLKGQDGTLIAQPMVNSDLNLDYQSKVQTLNNNMPAQTFPPRLTLRQALERILSQASDNPDYFIDARMRLWTFDDSTKGSVLDTTPYDVDLTPAPGANKVAPEDLILEWDNSNLWTGYYAKGANAKVSQTYYDSSAFSATSAGRMDSPYGIDLYGRRIGHLNAPDADTDAKVQRVVKAALRDTRNPVPRVTFSLSGTSCYDPTTGQRWRGGQLLKVKSPMHGLNGSGVDAGPWAGSDNQAGSGANTGYSALQPFRVKRVTTSFLSGKGDMHVEVEAGGRRSVLYQGGA